MKRHTFDFSALPQHHQVIEPKCDLALIALSFEFPILTLKLSNIGNWKELIWQVFYEVILCKSLNYWKTIYVMKDSIFSNM